MFCCGCNICFLMVWKWSGNAQNKCISFCVVDYLEEIKKQLIPHAKSVYFIMSFLFQEKLYMTHILKINCSFKAEHDK